MSLSCENWGSPRAAMTDRPGCECRMCVARRWDRLRGNKTTSAQVERERLERILNR